MTMQTSERYQMKELLSAIHQADSVVLFSHISPDGDTIGSALALKMALEQLHKPVRILLDGVVPVNLFFLPDLYSVCSSSDERPITPGTLAIAVDVSCDDRMGDLLPIYQQADVTAQVDHHPTNPAYAAINVIDGDAPATALVVYRLIRELGLPIQREQAVCLYTALSTDTGNFVYRNTDAEAFRMAADLMEAGLPLDHYARLLFRRKERGFVAMLGKALPHMEYLCDGSVAGLHVSRAEMDEAGATNANADGVVDYAIDTEGVRMAYFARETEDGHVKCSLRALAPYRVDQAAALFGGGGHQLAAGCTLDGPLDEAVRRVQQALTEAWHGGSQE